MARMESERAAAATQAAGAPAAQMTPMSPLNERTVPSPDRPVFDLPPATRPAGPAAPAAVTPAAAQMVASRPASMPSGMPAVSAAPLTAEAAQARRLYEQGLSLLNGGDLLSARAKLSGALASGALPPDCEPDCRAKLTQIATALIFSPQVYPGDEEDAYYYTIKSGDVLVNVVKHEKLCIGDQIIKRINNIEDVRKIRTGQKVKLIKGPFDAIVTKHAYTLDLYHHGMFVKSYRIGLGLDGKTPVGHWLVKTRVPQAPWTSSSGKIIYFGQAGYPLGAAGFWVGLQAEENTNTINLPGFGIHGTNEPDSIGRDASHGCIRLQDKDIEEVYGLLYEGISKVEVRP